MLTWHQYVPQKGTLSELFYEIIMKDKIEPIFQKMSPGHNKLLLVNISTLLHYLI